jgi:type IV secretory pathway VirB3-like protein
MMILTGLGSVMAFLATGNLFALLVGVPFYWIARILNNKDHQLMTVILKKYQKTPPIPNRQFWNGSNSYDVNINNEKD